MFNVKARSKVGASGIWQFMPATARNFIYVNTLVDERNSPFKETRAAAQLLLHAEASKLSTALRSTTYAGSWGELQLRRVVEMADMLPYCDFSEQVSSGGLRADLVQVA